MNKPLYQPFDGDFDLNHGDELGRLADDLLSSHWTEAIEIAVSLHGPAMKTEPPVIRIEVNLDESSESWDHDKFLPIPEGWTYEQVNAILEDGYTVYFEPVEIVVPELDAVTHEALRAWIGKASERKLKKAITEGKALLKAFKPQTEDDETLIEAINERLEILEEELSER